jgi:hypothetical protein
MPEGAKPADEYRIVTVGDWYVVPVIVVLNESVLYTVDVVPVLSEPFTEIPKLTDVKLPDTAVADA